MESRKLISMVNHVLEHKINIDKHGAVALARYAHKINNYAKFLSMPLTLGMFVPCDEDGSVLENPKDWKNWNDVYQANLKEGITKDRYTSQLEARIDCVKYQKAFDNVIFEGFEFKKDRLYFPNGYAIDEKENIFFDLEKQEMTIENISHINLSLTQSAITKYQI